ncbi:MAG: preprotein translocase subunit SecG [Bacteriovoracaceae bacterium]|jgi:preprotein translocase subunit SecG|nr:preprotein translocase subunit SecG [Bacteriovoracaceae bacterium]
MITTLMIFQASVSLLLIILVLLQFGKGAEAGLMGGGASESVFSGSQQGNILSKITVVLAVLFLGNSVLLAKLQSQRTGTSLMDGEAPIARQLNQDAKKEKPLAGAKEAVKVPKAQVPKAQVPKAQVPAKKK